MLFSTIVGQLPTNWSEIVTTANLKCRLVGSLNNVVRTVTKILHCNWFNNVHRFVLYYVPLSKSILMTDGSQREWVGLHLRVKARVNACRVF